MASSARHRNGHRHRAEAGFSVVEGLVAALILLIVILGVLPMVSQSLLNNISGNDSTSQSNAAVDGFETYLSLPFAAQETQIATGSTSRVLADFYLLDGDTWVDTVPSGDSAQFNRTATVEQFSVEDLDADSTFDTPLDGGTDPGYVHMKRITMQVETQRLFGRNRNQYTLVTVQAY